MSSIPGLLLGAALPLDIIAPNACLLLTEGSKN